MCVTIKPPYQRTVLGNAVFMHARLPILENYLFVVMKNYIKMSSIL